MKKKTLIFLLLAGPYLLYSQNIEIAAESETKCLDAIKEGERFYQNGLYERCIYILENVLKTCDLPKSEKLKVMENLARAYIEIDESGKAETTVNVMLKNFPHYELKEEENPEAYNRLVKKFKIHPKFSVGLRNTADWVNFKTTKIYSVLDDLDYTEPYSQELEGILHGFGLMYYGWAELEFDGGVSVNGDLIFKWTKFTRDFSKESEFDMNFSEQDNYLEIPVYLKKYFHIGKNTLPYLTAGMGWLYMIKADGNAMIKYVDSESPVYSGDIDMIEMRNRHTFEWLAGAGIGYKLKNLRLFIDLRYYGGFNSFTNPEKGLDNTLLVNEFFYVDNSVRLKQFEIGASASYTLFNSVKRIRK
jgi:opacity protein-like surface antigen